MRVASVVGARPNFVKLAPIHAILNPVVDHVIIHTGQHYDYELADIFFKDLNIPQPNFSLNIGPNSPMAQISDMIGGLEKIFAASKFDLVIVYGDTNSTFAGALTAMRMGIKVAHIEAGLRSFDRRMPEEINRILTDHLSELLFSPTGTAVDNLKKENVYGKIIYSGDINVEILNEAIFLSKKSFVLKTVGLEPKRYILFTMHRAENTIYEDTLISVLEAFERLSDVQIVFPIHPRTKKILQEKSLFGRLEECKNIKVIEPLGYIDFVKLMQNANKIITDSGGVQKESYMLNVPCITIRENTEWKETVEAGWNILTGTNTNKIVNAVVNWDPPKVIEPIFGSGDTSKIIRDYIIEND
jgi:UDP-N-acetylglucosamine 2-epimerase (non-hydrolysing)